MVQVFIIWCLSRVVIGLANFGQCMKFGLILGVMNRSGLCVGVEIEWTLEMFSLV